TAMFFSIAFLHILMPFWAFFLSNIIFNDDLLTIGFVISVAIPTGVTSVIWINISQGNLPFGLSIILIDTLLAPFIFPILLKLFAGEVIQIDSYSLIIDLLLMILLPSILGILFSELRKLNIHNIKEKFGAFAKLCLLAVVTVNSSAIAPYLKEATWQLLSVILVIFFLSLTGFTLSLIIGHFLFKDLQIVTTLVFIGGMRNIAIGIVIAVSRFPAKTAIPVVFCMLFQQVLAALFSKITAKYQMKYR